MELQLQAGQIQTLSPQVIQSLEVLQMNAQELRDYLQTLGQENPVVELSYDRDGEAATPEEPRGARDWLADTDRQNRWYHRQDSRETGYDDLPAGEEAGESLAEYVLRQISVKDDPQLERAVRLLVNCLDANGWLGEEPGAVAEVYGLPEDVVNRALELIQGAEPAGVGARNLRECLLLQLKRQGNANELTVRIVRDHLPDLAKNHFNHIARALKVSQTEIRQCLEEIRGLNPRPGFAFATPERTVYAVPDVLVIPGPGGLELMLNERGMPRVDINAYYVRMLRESDDPEVKTYLEEKVRQAQWVEGALRQRRETVLRCVEAIIRLQREYFYRGGPIRPMTLSDVAELTGVHESTVSRAVRGKWLQSPGGNVPMSKFFSRRLPAGEGEQWSAEEVKRLIKKMLMEEDPAHPLTDQRLCDLLANKGCVLARRTVAQYRSEMGFPPATGRRR